VLLSDAIAATYEQQRSGSGGSRTGSGSTKNASPNSLGKDIAKLFFDHHLHVGLMQIIEASNELCLIHASLNILIHISTLDNENKAKLAADLDISDQLLLILHEYDEDSKRFAVKLLCLLCNEEKIKSEVANLDGIQVLLSLLHYHHNTEILWNVIWCLVQLCSHDDNKREVRLMGGIALVLSILCDKSLDCQLESSEAEPCSSDKRSKAKFQIQAACCALVGELAFNETNSYQIVNTNGVYLVASKLLLAQTPDNTANNKEIERLHCNAWRTLRLLFSAERHRSLIKKLMPFSMFEQFVDIGNFKKDIKLYQPLVDSFYKLSKEEADLLKQQIKNCNQSQVPTNYINDYAVYEIIGSGAFGRVHKVKKKNSNVFLAMKEINTYNLNSLKGKYASLGEIVNEVTIIRNNLKHPNIVRYLKTFKESESLYIVMELIDGTPLSQHVRTLKEKQELWSEETVWVLFIQIVLALKYLHKEKHIVHRDLTSNNIMLSENDRITITDFGLAKLKENDCSKMLSVVGTMFYSCPEIIKNEPYNEKADIWAMGCVLYEMCCLEPPFCTSNMLALATKITQSDYDHGRLERNSYSALISSVVQSCLIVDPVRRPDVVGVAALVAEKILNYTDSIRYKCVGLEKKLEKEKNKTQKLFCNKQDLNYQQRNSLYQPAKAEQEEKNSSTASFSSNTNIPVPIKPRYAELRVERSISLSNAPSKVKDVDLTPRNEQVGLIFFVFQVGLVLRK
jgi:NIMA (never in mitosis gene a)-related kinase